MKQRINFLSLLPQLQSQRFSLITLIVIDIIWLSALMGLYFFDKYHLPQKQAVVKALQQDQIAAEERLAKIEEEFPKEASTAQLQKKADALTQEIAGKSELIALLASGDFQNTTGFSSYLQALADYSVSGVALTHISLRQGGKIIALDGQAVSVNAALDFSHQLSKSVIFADDKFKLSKLTSSNDNHYIDIQLTNLTRGNEERSDEKT